MSAKFMAVFMSLTLTARAELPAPKDLPSREARPDPLTMLDGTKVTSPEQWQSNRKPQLKELFQHYMYGAWPEAPTNLKGTVLHEDKQAFGGIATLREIEIRFDVKGVKNPTPIRLLVVTPNNVKGPVPCFVGMNFQGNQALVTDPKVRLPDAWMYDRGAGVVKNKATDASRGTALDVWAFENAAKRGYAIATFYSGDIQADRPKVEEGLRAVLKPSGPADTGCVIGWAWGISRAVDYLVTDPAIDAKKIAVVGHSRLGKTALVAGAFDDRIALVIPHQAGVGGSGPSRHDDPKAEGVKRITTSFPHWFCPNYAAFGEALDKLPFDQHCLVALCAPRPVLFTCAQEDLWSNPAGQFEMLKAATPVYELFGVEGLKASSMPDMKELVKSRLRYYIRPGKHSMTFGDWDTYMQFADTWMK